MKHIILIICALLISGQALADPINSLQTKLQNLEIQKATPQTHIPAGPPLKLGTVHLHVALLHRRINEIYGTVLSESNEFDYVTEDFVKQIQQDNSINADGVVGQQTRDSLNVNPAQSQALISQSILEWETITRNNLPDRYVVVNIPSFELITYEYGEEVFRSKVIVGTKKDYTPRMIAEAFSLKFNPDWTAPPGIRRDYIRKMNAGKMDYFAKNGVKILYDKNGQVKFWQPPSRSYLGNLKIELETPHHIYLHDTNSPRLFNKSVRALSHGCIRVQEYVTLAAWLANVDENDIQSKIATRKTFWQKVDRVPVFVVYMLAYPNKDGNVSYFSDVYGIVK